MGLSLQQDESAAAVSESVARYCATIVNESNFGVRWKGLAELGLFALPEIFASSAHVAIAASMEILGRKGFFGPVADTLTFATCAPAELVEPVAGGEAVVSLGRPPLVPYPHGRVIHVTESDGNAVLLEVTSVKPVEMLSGDPWAIVQARPGRVLGPFAPWADCYDVAISAWLVGAGLELIEAAAAHAAQRVQFGKAIGEFQAVSAPLARAVLALDAAKVLVEAGATRLDAGDGRLVTAARWSASRAAEQAAIAAHQTYGAFGVLENGPVYARSRRIRQIASQFPEERPVDALTALRANGSLALVGRN